jgi:hypothetical protein
MRILVKLLEQPEWMVLFYDISLESAEMFQIISGLILVTSVVRIRQFFVRINAKSWINTGMLLRHASAFVLYMVSNFVYAAACGYWVWFPTTENYRYVIASGLFLNLCSLIS